MKRMLLCVGAVCAALAALAEDAWLKSGDSQYVNTGYFMKQASRIEVDFQMASTTASLLFGAWDGGAKLCTGFWVTGGKFAFLLHDNGYGSTQTSVAADTARHTAVIDVPNQATTSLVLKDAAGNVQW